MWIKSQNGDKLVDCYEFYIRESRIDSYCSICSEHGKIGTYESRKQAMRVLGKIQNCINGYPSKEYEGMYDCPLAGIEYHGVFVMPAIESEV